MSSWLADCNPLFIMRKARRQKDDTMADTEHAPAMAPPISYRWKVLTSIDGCQQLFRSSTIPAIYIQQFWDTICFDSKAGSYKCQLDEQWFDLTQDTLRDALQITPVDKNQAFSPPPTPDTLIEFVNELGYPREVINLSNVTTNDMFQPWRALTTIINLCLTGKTSGFERPRAPSIHNFTEDKRNLAQQAQGKKKATIILIPSIRFTKLIIFHLQWLHNFHPRPESLLHLRTEEPVLGREVVKKRTVKSSKQLVDEFVDEGVPAAKPSLKDTEEAILETDTGKLQPLPEVPGKGKEKVESYSRSILNQRPEEYFSLYAELGLYGSDTESDEEMPSVVRSGAQDEGQAGPDPDFSFGDQFLNDKPSEADNEKTTADTKAESMVSVTIQQDISVFPPMTSPVIGPSDPIIIKRMGELEEFIANLVEENQALETRLDKQGSRINKLETMDLPKMIREQTVEFIDSQEIDRKINESVKEVVISSVKHAMRAPLCARFKDLPTSDMKEILLQRMLEENYDKGHADHRVAYVALQDSIRRDESEDFDIDKAQEETKKKSKQDSPKTPPGSPPQTTPVLHHVSASGPSGHLPGAPPILDSCSPLTTSVLSLSSGDQSTKHAAPSSQGQLLLAEYSLGTNDKHPD
ncbi:hypothetical protein Tco_0774018 [Tanacetum coccineum]|uniref:Monodehydroascorbate reductase n=1 Tax=Tanacetum coccineum TaxID=301880 RepID=A0ABQ4ZND5_9ASTR